VPAALLLAAAALACAAPALPGGGAATPSAADLKLTAAGVQATAIPLPPSATPGSAQTSVQTVEVAEGGFSASAPEGWFIEKEGGLLYVGNHSIDELKNVDTMPAGGLAVLMSVFPDMGLLDQMTLEEMLTGILSDNEDVESFETPFTLSVGGSQAVGADVHMTQSEEFGDIPVDGFFILVDRADNYELLLILAVASPADWPALRPTALEIVESVSFFAPAEEEEGGESGIENPPPPGGVPAGFVWQTQRAAAGGAEDFGRLRGMAPWEGMLYVADRDGAIWVLDTTTGQVYERIDVAQFGIKPLDLAFAPDGQTLYLADSAINAIIRFDLPARQYVAEIGRGEFTGGGPYSVATSFTGDIFATDDVTLLHFTPDGTLVDTIPLAGQSESLEKGHIGAALDGTFYLVDEKGLLIHVDGAGLFEVAHVAAETGAVYDIAVGLDGSLLLAAENCLFSVDPASGAVRARYGVYSDVLPYYQGGYRAPRGIAAFLDGSVFYADSEAGEYAIVSAFRFP
jgi:hypothetical protein